MRLLVESATAAESGATATAESPTATAAATATAESTTATAESWTIGSGTAIGSTVADRDASIGKP
jgi:hypothetical protein